MTMFIAQHPENLALVSRWRQSGASARNSTCCQARLTFWTARSIASSSTDAGLQGILSQEPLCHARVPPSFPCHV